MLEPIKTKHLLCTQNASDELTGHWIVKTVRWRAVKIRSPDCNVGLWELMAEQSVGEWLNHSQVLVKAMENEWAGHCKNYDAQLEQLRHGAWLDEHVGTSNDRWPYCSYIWRKNSTRRFLTSPVVDSVNPEFARTTILGSGSEIWVRFRELNTRNQHPGN